MAAQLNQRATTRGSGEGDWWRAITDVRARYDIVAPLDGVVTNLPVRVGETVVPGVQNSPASTIMTIADMSLITAEVKVDETDIVNVKLNQIADITIDAIPNKTFKGHVIEIGNTAILRSTGVAASQSNTSSQEAKDFKVVVALDDPPEEIRPGTFLHRENHNRHPPEGADDSDSGADGPAKGRPGAEETKATRRQAATQARSGRGKGRRKKRSRAFSWWPAARPCFVRWRPELPAPRTSKSPAGYKEGDEIVTGSYQVIRTMRNEAQVKVDNKVKATKCADRYSTLRGSRYTRIA